MKNRGFKLALLAGFCFGWTLGSYAAPSPDEQDTCVVTDIFRGHPTVKELARGEIRLECEQGGKRFFYLDKKDPKQAHLARALKADARYEFTFNAGSMGVRYGPQSAEWSARQPVSKYARVPMRWPVTVQESGSNVVLGAWTTSLTAN